MKNKLSFMQIKNLFLGGSTQAEIALKAGVSRQAIQTRLRRAGIRRNDGGAWLRETLREKTRKRIEARCQKIWGMSKASWREIRIEYGYKPFNAFCQHRRNCRERGISFQFTFAQWWQLWLSSGRWHQRGKRDGKHLYVMARIADRGAYDPMNVRIVTQSENMREHHVVSGHSLRPAV